MRDPGIPALMRIQCGRWPGRLSCPWTPVFRWELSSEGGNFWRGRTSEAIVRTKADQIGMLATVMNCIYVSEIFRTAGMKTAIFTPFACGTMTELFSKDKANAYFAEGRAVFFAGGTGHPYFSTDTGIALRAIEMDADCILLAKSIDGVYDSDPKVNPRLRSMRQSPFKRLSTSSWRWWI